jgi:hypothetical protein
VARVRAALDVRHAEGLRVERPRRSLESLFLEIVERARSEGAATSGARSGGRLADFLDGDDRGDRMIEDGTSTADAQVNVAEGVDADLLERLTQRPS